MRRVAILVVVLWAGAAPADPTSGVDAALFRPSYDTNGIFAVEGARLMAVRDIAFKILAGYGKAPITVAVPGIGDGGKDRILDELFTLDMAFGMTITDRIAIGFDAAAYRTSTARGYGVRGTYIPGAPGATPPPPSTGLIALRPLSNIDPSASSSQSKLGDELSGPLDTRVALKLSLYQDPTLALTAIGTVVLPFGDDEMLLGDRDLVYEPELAFEWRPDRVHQTRLVANAAAHLRRRTALESYDPATQTPSDAKVFLDVGSEAVTGLGAMLELSPRVALGAEAQAFFSLPDAFDHGACIRSSGARCSALTAADYFANGKRGDFTVLAVAGLSVRVDGDLTAQLMIGTSQGGARGDEVRVTTGIVWAPQPEGAAAPGRNDRDGDGVPDSLDACPDEPEDKDGYQDEDGCPDLDNDGDGIPDHADQCPNDPEDKDGFQDTDGCPEHDNDSDGIPDSLDRCPNEAEDKDGFEDDDGCPDLDNDGDGIPDKDDKCPNDPETVNGFEDEDGCPDVRATTGPEERSDRIDLKGQPLLFDRTNKLTPAAKALLVQVATIIKQRRLTIRAEIHTALGTRARNAAAVAAQQPKDQLTAQRRATSVLEFLISQGVPQAQLQVVAIGSVRPLGAATPSDAINERVELIKLPQGAP